MLPAPDSLSDLIALVPAPPGAAICDGSGECRRAGRDEARTIFQSGNALVAHAAFAAGRLRVQAQKPLYDVLELFAFLKPGRPFVPSALGLARALSLGVPQTPEQSAAALFDVARCLLDEARDLPPETRAALSPLAATLTRGGWRWGPLLQKAFGQDTPHGSPIAGMEAWRGLPQWEDEAPVGNPGSQPVAADEARARLLSLVGTPRPEQGAYSDAATYAFGPREDSGAPRIALVEAGTGTGKTLAYLVPAILSGRRVVISTATKNLQEQIWWKDIPLLKEKCGLDFAAAYLKGRSNYFCLERGAEFARAPTFAVREEAAFWPRIEEWAGRTRTGDRAEVDLPDQFHTWRDLSARAWAERVAVALNQPERRAARARALAAAAQRRRSRGWWMERVVGPLDPASEQELARVLARHAARPENRPLPGEILRAAVAGFAYHGGETVLAQLCERPPLALVREPDNPHDPLAVRIDGCGVTLGYVPRSVNAAIATRLDAGEDLAAQVIQFDPQADPWTRLVFAITGAPAVAPGPARYD